MFRKRATKRAEITGQFEEATLMAVFHLAGHAYGRPLLEELTERLGRVVSVGAIYTTLDRLEQDGLVTSKLVEGEPTPKGVRTRRYYAITGAGIGALNDAHENRRAIWAGISFPIGAGR